MKKILKTLGVCIGFPLINLIMVLLVQNGFIALSGNSVESINKYTFLLVLLADVLTLVAIFLILIPSRERLIKGISIKNIGVKELLYTIALSIGISVLLLSLSGILTMLVPSYQEVQKQLGTLNNSILMIIVGVVLVPIYEEIVYRGIIFGYLKKNYNIILALVVQALVFSIMHLNLVQSIYTFLLGVVLGLIYMYTESIYGNIIMHMIFNLLGVVVMPKLAKAYPSMVSVALIIGIGLFIFSSLKILKKYDDVLYSK
ncbi:CPBP family intramembrane glutamic endopeptidase [Clostridium sp. B9]|uniref:CPBP family intramembrane glutamic endopeptidase n=1 Tax=Clostridium sp. B9 TaxID=3423224 RepID=UPI003D2EE666